MTEVHSLSTSIKYTLDVRGYTCPYPQYYTIKALDRLREGENLEIVLDNQPSVAILQDTVQKKGCTVISADRGKENAWRILIRK